MARNNILNKQLEVPLETYFMDVNYNGGGVQLQLSRSFRKSDCAESIIQGKYEGFFSLAKWLERKCSLTFKPAPTPQNLVFAPGLYVNYISTFVQIKCIGIAEVVFLSFGGYYKD